MIAAYNEDLAVSPEIDSQFASIAAERVRAHPVRYYIQLPLLRIADMWLRPRTETLPSDRRALVGVQRRSARVDTGGRIWVGQRLLHRVSIAGRLPLSQNPLLQFTNRFRGNAICFSRYSRES